MADGDIAWQFGRALLCSFRYVRALNDFREFCLFSVYSSDIRCLHGAACGMWLWGRGEGGQGESKSHRRQRLMGQSERAERWREGAELEGRGQPLVQKSAGDFHRRMGHERERRGPRCAVSHAITETAARLWELMDLH